MMNPDLEIKLFSLTTCCYKHPEIDISLSDSVHGAHCIRPVTVKKITWDQKRLQNVDGAMGLSIL